MKSKQTNNHDDRLNEKELNIIKNLANNKKRIRNKSIEELSDYISENSAKEAVYFTEQLLLVIWKGLFYCMYNSDKLLIQEDVADRISTLIHKFRNNLEKQLFFKSALQIFNREWKLIDNRRSDKYFMLLTNTFRQMLVHLRKENWEKREVEKCVENIKEEICPPLDNMNSKTYELKSHFVDILIPEISNIGRTGIKFETVKQFLQPFFETLAVSTQMPIKKRIREKIINELLEQTSGAPDEDDDDEIFDEDGYLKQDAHLDVRASGGLYAPEIDVDLDVLADNLEEICERLKANRKSRNFVNKICSDLRTGFVETAEEALQDKKEILNAAKRTQMISNTSYKKMRLL